MAQIRVNGQAATGAFYGYTPLVVKAACTAGFLADSVDSTTGAITENGFSKAVKVLETFGSIQWLGAQSNNSIVAIVDGPTFNAGVAGDYAELDTALTAVRDGSGALTVTTSATLNGDGTFTFA